MNHLFAPTKYNPWELKDDPEKCPDCESEDIEYFDSDERGDIYICKDCKNQFYG